ncbi:hypothetical protein Pint_34814 [Pistacia integerrima]|uniref:Uncharacterized protein n=1 Tax=Pistacia integerrima TaxID=434235 RepID=A0ACC0X4K0_9ROSI|nr:hypothetical protein Pint_34814 [Pistacia integerrima]
MAITLNNGFKMPIVGLSVWRMEGKDIRDLIINAIKIGYGHFDCADHGHVVDAGRDSLKKLQLDYLDLYLVHFAMHIWHTNALTLSMKLPNQLIIYSTLVVKWVAEWFIVSYIHATVRGTGSALDEDGVLEIDTTYLIRNHPACYGRSSCSNYDIFLTRDCLAYAKLKPAHILLSRRCCGQHRMVRHCSCLDDPVLKGLAEKYKKTVAQIVLKWGMQRNTVVIPKTSKLERLKENYQISQEFTM